MTALGGPEPRAPGAVRRLADGWDAFWCAPRSVAPLVPLRVALGLIVAVWGLTLLPDARALLGPDGVLPTPPVGGLRTGVLHVLRSDAAALVVVGALVPLGLAIALGAATRPASALAWLLLLSVGRRDPWILNSGDVLLRTAVGLLALTPAGAAWSVDRWWRARRAGGDADPWSVPHGSPWGLRLLQVQLSLLYLVSVLEKVRGSPWADGTALSMTWRVGDLARAPLPLVVHDSALASSVVVLATLVIELALAVLVWSRAARPWVMTAGVALHLVIEATLMVGFFSVTILALYLAFAEPITAERWLAAVRARRWPRPRVRTPAPA